MSSQFIFAVTTPAGNEAAGAKNHSLVAFFFTTQATELLHDLLILNARKKKKVYVWSEL